MKKLTAIEENRLYVLVAFKIQELEEQLANATTTELQEQYKQQIAEYKELLDKF